MIIKHDDNDVERDSFRRTGFRNGAPLKIERRINSSARD